MVNYYITLYIGGSFNYDVESNNENIIMNNE